MKINGPHKLRELRRQGYGVHVRHLRYANGWSVGAEVNGTTKELRAAGMVPDPKGGATVAEIYQGDSRETQQLVAIGVATCSDLDTFNRRIGLDIALGRALKQLRAAGPTQLEEKWRQQPRSQPEEGVPTPTTSPTSAPGTPSNASANTDAN